LHAGSTVAGQAVPSFWHVALQPSPDVVLSSSHCSPGSTTPSPHSVLAHATQSSNWGQSPGPVHAVPATLHALPTVALAVVASHVCAAGQSVPVTHGLPEPLHFRPLATVVNTDGLMPSACRTHTSPPPAQSPSTPQKRFGSLVQTPSGLLSRRNHTFTQNRPDDGLEKSASDCTDASTITGRPVAVGNSVASSFRMSSMSGCTVWLPPCPASQLTTNAMSVSRRNSSLVASGSLHMKTTGPADSRSPSVGALVGAHAGHAEQSRGSRPVQNIDRSHRSITLSVIWKVIPLDLVPARPMVRTAPLVAQEAGVDLDADDAAESVGGVELTGGGRRAAGAIRLAGVRDVAAVPGARAAARAAAAQPVRVIRDQHGGTTGGARREHEPRRAQRENQPTIHCSPPTLAGRHHPVNTIRGKLTAHLAGR
jgi:hypothetical protein